jgi:precorrin-8X/cobalt-precorrin-8 methylmutase
MTDRLRDPAEIYKASFATVAAEADLARFDEADRHIAIRMIHACGMVDLAADIRIAPGFVESVKRAVADGHAIITDCEMVRHGIIRRLVPESEKIICTLNDPAAKAIGLAKQTTRSAAAVELWHDHLAGAVIIIGNAPTALFALLEMIDAGAPKPAAIIGCPVGFVGAAESKDELLRDPRGIPYATVLGRRGGSAIAAAAFNAVFAP